MTDQFDEAKYVDALLVDLDREYNDCQQKTLGSIFFGGGTPSLFSADAIRRVIDHARELFGFGDIEITLEANPGTVEQAKFQAYRDAGVNRLSIGIQSFQNEHLHSLGRIHDRRQAITAVETAQATGFENINLDLMFGLPQQSVRQALQDIYTATEFNVQHISHYQLTIEPNTYFYKHTPLLPENDSIWEMQTRCQEVLFDRGYYQYEISAYAKAGRQCQHNINYWRFGDYIGIGAGAHGKLTRISPPGTSAHDLQITRYWKYRQPEQYTTQALAGDAVSGRQQLRQSDIVFEFLLNALRLKAGCDLATAVKHTGLPLTAFNDAVTQIDPSLLCLENGIIRTTDKGYLFLNDILEKLL